MSGPVQSILDAYARRDVHAYVARTLTDEGTGQLVTLAPHHRRIIDVLVGSDRGVVVAFAEAGKSSLAAPVLGWLIARDPSLRCALVSGTLQQATRQLGGVARHVESPDVARIWSGRLAPGAQWTQHALSVAAKPAQLRDPNVQAASLDGGTLLGARLDLVVVDDVDSVATTATPAARDATWRWFTATVLSRLAPRGRVVILSTAWHREDTAHRFAALGNVDIVRVPIQDAHGNPTWPARWPLDRVAQRRKELGPRLARRVLDADPVADDSCVFDSAMVRGMVDRGLNLPTTLFDGPRGRHVVGVDLGMTANAHSDESAIVVVRCLDDGVREVVHVETFKLGFDALVGRIVEVTSAFRATAAIESNAGGTFVYDQVRKSVPATALHTSASSKVMRVEMLHAELSAQRWHFRPREGRLSDGMRKLADGLESFSMSEHCPDSVAALLVAVEQVRALENKPKIQFLRVDLMRR